MQDVNYFIALALERNKTFALNIWTESKRDEAINKMQSKQKRKK